MIRKMRSTSPSRSWAATRTAGSDPPLPHRSAAQDNPLSGLHFKHFALLTQHDKTTFMSPLTDASGPVVSLEFSAKEVTDAPAG
jgi:hypothetical protein